MRQLLRSGGLAQPDLVEYDPGSVILRWTGPKLAVVVDLDGPPDGCESSGDGACG